MAQNDSALSPGDAVRVAGYKGVACRYIGPGKSAARRIVDHEWEGYEYTDPGVARIHMVGDDRVFEVDIDDCKKLSEDGFCVDCGQIGCSHGRY